MSAHRTVVAARVAVCWLGVFTVVGCTPHDSPASPPASSASLETPAAASSPDPTPSTKGPSTPLRPAVLDAQADTKAAVAAATYYLALYNYAYQTGDSDAFEVMSESGCLFCNDVIEDVASERAARQHAEGGDFHVVSSSALRLRPDFFTATLQVVQDPLQTLSPTGAVVDSKPTAAPYLIQFALDHGREGWSVKEVSVQAAPGAK